MDPMAVMLSAYVARREMVSALPDAPVVVPRPARVRPGLAVPLRAVGEFLIRRADRLRDGFAPARG